MFCPPACRENLSLGDCVECYPWGSFGRIAKGPEKARSGLGRRAPCSESENSSGGMSTLVERAEALAIDVSCTDDTLRVLLSDGREVSAPLARFPRLLGATARQRARWELIGGGIGIHWESIDEDISVASLLQPENFMRLPNTRVQPAREKRRVPSGRRRTRG